MTNERIAQNAKFRDLWLRRQELTRLKRAELEPQ